MSFKDAKTVYDITSSAVSKPNFHYEQKQAVFHAYNQLIGALYSLRDAIKFVVYPALYPGEIQQIEHDRKEGMNLRQVNGHRYLLRLRQKEEEINEAMKIIESLRPILGDREETDPQYISHMYVGWLSTIDAMMAHYVRIEENELPNEFPKADVSVPMQRCRDELTEKIRNLEEYRDALLYELSLNPIQRVWRATSRHVIAGWSKLKRCISKQ